MLFFAAVAALAVAANAQTLRVQPAIIGSTSAGHEQVIALAAGPQVHHHKVHAVHTPIQHHKVVVAQPQAYTIAQPQTFTIAQPQAYTIAKPVHQVAYVAQPTVYKKVVAAHHVAQPYTVAAAHHVVKPFVATAHHVEQPIVKVQTFEAPQVVKVAHHHQPLTAVHEEKYEIQPYSFGFESEDEHQNKHGRQETKDANGVITGQYTVAGVDGIARIVSYVADHEGFRASVKTNEPGTLTSAPAGVNIESSAAVPARR